jgi:hypothetical protein
MARKPVLACPKSYSGVLGGWVRMGGQGSSGNPTNRPSDSCRVSRAVPRVKSRNSVFLYEHTANQATERLFVTKRVQWRYASGTQRGNEHGR